MATGWLTTSFGIPSIPLVASSVVRLVQTGVTDGGGPLYAEEFTTNGTLDGVVIPSLGTTWYAAGTRTGGHLIPDGTAESTGPDFYDVAGGVTGGDVCYAGNNAFITALGVRCEMVMVVRKSATNYSANSRLLMEFSQTFDDWTTYRGFSVGIRTPLGGSHSVVFNDYTEVGEDLSSSIPIASLFTTSDHHTFVFTTDESLLSLSIDDVHIGDFDTTGHEVSPLTAGFNNFYTIFAGLEIDSFSITPLGEPVVAVTHLPLAQLPEPTGFQSFHAAPLGRVTRWSPRAYLVTHEICDAVGVQVTTFGGVFTWGSPINPTNWALSAQGTKSATFGEASVRTVIELAVYGSASTQYGTHNAVAVLNAAALHNPAVFGTVECSLRGRVSGFSATTLPPHGMGRTQYAAHTYREVRWGRPSTERSATYKACRMNKSTRFGRPKGLRLNNYQTEGWQLCSFGGTSSFQAYRVRMIPPTTHFTKPLLKRIPLC